MFRVAINDIMERKRRGEKVVHFVNDMRDNMFTLLSTIVKVVESIQVPIISVTYIIVHMVCIPTKHNIK